MSDGTAQGKGHAIVVPSVHGRVGLAFLTPGICVVSATGFDQEGSEVATGPKELSLDFTQVEIKGSNELTLDLAGVSAVGIRPRAEWVCRR